MSEQSPLLSKVLHELEEIQAIDIISIDVRDQTTITDYMIICSGRSNRHVKSIAQHVIEKMKAAGFVALNQTGLNSGDWALVDFGDVVLHVMQPDSRTFYNIEGLWK